jgi:hypothetical protein
MGLGHADDAIAGAAQGGVYADDDLPARKPGTQAASLDRLRHAPGAAETRLEFLVLAGSDRHRRGVRTWLSRLKSKHNHQNKSKAFSILYHFYFVIALF